MPFLENRPKLSLAMIVRNSEAHLAKTLDSVKDAVDEIVIVDTGSIDATVAIAKSYTDQVSHFTWIDDFSAARNYSFRLCSNDLVLWLDDDDIVVNAEELCEFARIGYANGLNQMFVDYDYTHDRHGNCRLRQQRERFVDRTVNEWRGRIHESCCATALLSKDYFPRERGFVKHTSYVEEEADHNARLRRNLAIMEDMEKKGEIDHRMTLFMANALYGIRKYDEAIQWYRRYTSEIQRSGNHYSALCTMGDALMKKGMLADARIVFGQAVMLYPKLGTAYYKMAQTHVILQEWERALEWAEEAISHREGQKGEMHHDPSDAVAVPHSVKAEAFMQMMRIDEARAEIREALAVYPDSEALLYLEHQITAREASVKGGEAFCFMRDLLLAEGHQDRLTTLADSVPDTIKGRPEVLQHRSRPKSTDRPTLGIFCPIDYEQWGPKSLETGIGGSETAVIQMSRELRDLGWDVTVYCRMQTRDIGTYDGIRWTHYGGYNPSLDHHSVMVTWREPRAPISWGQNCDLSIFWAHDIFTEDAWLADPELLYDRVMVLSEYQKDLYTVRIPEELIEVTANGTDPRSWAPMVEPKQGKVVYSSCPSRGLVHLLREWSYVIDTVPDAELHCFYGFNKAFELGMQSHPAYRRLYAEIEGLRRQKGIFWHGRVGKDELYQHYSDAHVWAYPCIFPEISCITAMEAQIHGAMPVVNDFAALKETVRFGSRETYDFKERGGEAKFATSLIEALKQERFPEREEMMAWARQTFRWDEIARSWDLLFKSLLSVGSGATRKLKPGEIPRRQKPRFSLVS